MARQIEARGGSVARLVVFDTPVPLRLNPLDKARGAAYRARYHLDRVRTLDPRAMFDYALGVGGVASTRLRRRLGPMGFAASKDVLATKGAPAAFRLVDQENRRKTTNYSLEEHAPVAAAITLFVAARGSRSALPPELDGRYAWRVLTRGRFDVVRVEASHLSMLQPPDMTPVAEALKELLRAEDVSSQRAPRAA
jgi:thioesterase domain-containing protein